MFPQPLSQPQALSQQHLDDEPHPPPQKRRMKMMSVQLSKPHPPHPKLDLPFPPQSKRINKIKQQLSPPKIPLLHEQFLPPSSFIG